MLKLSARTVSVLFVLPLPGYLFGAWLSARLSFRLSQGKLMRLGIAFLALGSLIILVPGLLGMVSAASLGGRGCGLLHWQRHSLSDRHLLCHRALPGSGGHRGSRARGMQNLGLAW